MVAVLSVVRNEASNWLPKLLPIWEELSDVILVIDDGSTDDTPQILQSSTKVEYHRREADAPMWGHEAPVRQELWELGVRSGADWLFFLDADMVPASDPSELFLRDIDAVGFTLYDLWNLDPMEFRHDGYWKGHTVYRTWAIRNPGQDFEAEWSSRGIHCGHLPTNFYSRRTLFAPPEMSLLHFAYATPEARERKMKQYADRMNQLTRHEYEHALSIMDDRVSLQLLPPIQWQLNTEF